MYKSETKRVKTGRSKNNAMEIFEIRLSEYDFLKSGSFIYLLMFLAFE